MGREYLWLLLARPTAIIVYESDLKLMNSVCKARCLLSLEISYSVNHKITACIELSHICVGINCKLNSPVTQATIIQAFFVVNKVHA